ncbi:MAG TPA: RNA polymerase sigma factor [Lentimicrobium sp.]|nr:RNA polymerase sigma factor [Lentimicrobium sp.]
MADSNALINRVKSGDNIAAGDLITLYQDKVFSICYSFLNNIQDTEDLTQEVFIDVLKNLKNFRGDSSPGTWIYRIAVNHSLNFIRNKKKYRFWKHLDDILTLKPVKEEPASDELILEKEEEKIILMKAIDSLPENQKSAFTLNKIDELSYNEVSEIMGISLSATESLIHRAKINLQKSLRQYFKE